jgi:hypothetical protein
MTLTQLIALFRQEADDAVAPYLFSDTAVTGWLNEAVEEACVRALLVKDWSTTAVCSIDVAAGTSAYSTHASIINITRASFLVDGGSDSTVLYQTTEFELDRLQPGWREETGEPEAFIHHDTKIRLGCIPESAGTLSLEVNRIPLALMATGTDVPEIAARHHRTLVQWALFRAFSVPDSEVVDPNKAAMAEREFTKMFGLRMDATTRRDHETSLPHRNAAIWL